MTKERNSLLSKIRSNAIKMLIKKYKEEFDYLILELKKEYNYNKEIEKQEIKIENINL